jgi:hypothetical protein
LNQKFQPFVMSVPPAAELPLAGASTPTDNVRCSASLDAAELPAAEEAAELAPESPAELAAELAAEPVAESAAGVVLEQALSASPTVAISAILHDVRALVLLGRVHMPFLQVVRIGLCFGSVVGARAAGSGLDGSVVGVTASAGEPADDGALL